MGNAVSIKIMESRNNVEKEINSFPNILQSKRINEENSIEAGKHSKVRQDRRIKQETNMVSIFFNYQYSSLDTA